jgi:hypothetical protein
MAVSRLPFALNDLEREVRKVAPHVGVITIGLAPGTFGPVAEELSNHSGEPLPPGADVFRIGNVALRRLAD